jgi:putative ABC transport system permease protein
MTVLLEDTLRDLRHAGRSLRRSPGFAAVAVVSLALGMGAGTAIFSVFDALMWRPLPVDHPETLITFTRTVRGRGTTDAWPYPTFERLRRLDPLAGAAVSALVDRSSVAFDRSSDGGPVTLGLVSGTYFRTLGVPAARGRVLQPADDEAGAAAVAVVSHGFWRRRFGAAEEAVGRTFTLNDTTYSVVGIAAPGFSGEEVGTPVEVWIPAARQPQVMPERRGLLDNPRSSWVRIVARMKPGITMAQAQAAARVAVADGSVSPPAPDSLNVEPAGRGYTPQREAVSTPLAVLLAVAGLVLLVACANVAALLMVRGAARQKEMALRLAMGAGRGRLVRQLLAESAVLTTVAGAAGLLVASWMTSVLVAMVGSGRLPF